MARLIDAPAWHLWAGNLHYGRRDAWRLLGAGRPPPRRAPDANPFESGILPLRDTAIRFPSQFYLIAMLFVISTWKWFRLRLGGRGPPAGWAGYAGMLAFLTLLLLALAYLWRSGALEWRAEKTPAVTSRLRRL